MVQVIDNFLTNEEVHFLLTQLSPLLRSIDHVVAHTETCLGFANSTEASKWNYNNPIIPLTDSTEINQASLMLTTIYKKLKTELETFYQKDLGLVQFIFNRMHPGAKNTVHIDNATGMYPELEYSALIYLNDCAQDFMGGEIIFPNQNIQLETKKGMLVFFRGDENTPHGVNAVLQGHRDNFITFFKSL
jgi:predicted 2-oxoglutarate/Fe(II)-dependent dioxygenase YbiX